MFHTYGVMSVNENRDLSRSAAERHYLLQSLPESSARAEQIGRRPGWRRLRSSRAAATGGRSGS